MPLFLCEDLMSTPRRRRSLATLVLFAQLGLFLGGCSKDEGAVVNFPESNMQPTITPDKTAETSGGTSSQGDPSQYTR